MSDIFIYQENARPPRPNHVNNCHGHHTSINAGGNGHSVDDGCGCDGANPASTINFIVPILTITVALLIIYKKLKNGKSFKYK